MRVYIPDMDEFFGWMDKVGLQYVVLRGFLGYEQGYPAHGAKEDIDLLVEDVALLQIGLRYHKFGKKQGVKCDIYNVSGTDHGGYLGHAYYPRALAEMALDDRRMWKNRFYVPSARAHLLTLIYHIAYQKAEGSKLAIDTPQESKYKAELDMLTAELGIDLPHTLMDFHTLLKKERVSIPYDVLVTYVQNDYAKTHVRVGLFYSLLVAEQKGEMNLFVIRSIAVETGAHLELLRFLRQNYEMIIVKDIPLVTRLTQSGKMRGGKWRRGGRPEIAVVVFDTHPTPTTDADRQNHPYVLNARQFVKRGWREWFTEKTGSKASANPIHSTDNEAEALAHLPLFFSAHEQEDILHRIVERRERL